MPKFKLLVGNHIEAMDEEGNDIVHHPGEVFESKHDLVAKFGPKFELMDDSHRVTYPDRKMYYPKADKKSKTASGAATATVTAARPTVDEVSKMNLEQLREFAAGEDLDLGNNGNVDQVRNIVRNYLKR